MTKQCSWLVCPSQRKLFNSQFATSHSQNLLLFNTYLKHLDTIRQFLLTSPLFIDHKVPSPQKDREWNHPKNHQQKKVVSTVCNSMRFPIPHDLKPFRSHSNHAKTLIMTVQVAVGEAVHHAIASWDPSTPSSPRSFFPGDCWKKHRSVLKT